MVSLLLDSTRLDVHLNATEHALSFRKRNISIPRSQIARVQLTDDAWTWLRGVPEPATVIPSTVAIGAWKYVGGKDFALIRRRRPSIVFELDGHDEFQRVIVTTRYGLDLARELAA